MPKFLVTVTETYTTTFEVEADGEQAAIDMAEDMAVERSFPGGHSESCERTIQADER